MRTILLCGIGVFGLIGCQGGATPEEVFTTAIVHVGADGSRETSVLLETLAERNARSSVAAVHGGLQPDAVVDSLCTKGDTMLCDGPFNPRAIPPGPWQCVGNVACISGSDSINLEDVPRGGGNFAGYVKNIYVGGWSGELRWVWRITRCSFSFDAYSPGWHANTCTGANTLYHYIN